MNIKNLYYCLLASATTPIEVTLNKDPRSYEYHYEYYMFHIGDASVTLTCDEVGRFVGMRVDYDN